MSTSIIHINDEMLMEDLNDQLSEFLNTKDQNKVVEIVKDLLGL